MEQKIRGDVFDGIRQAMKSQNLTYTELAAKMKVSEATIKRMFADKDCKVSRLLEICDHLKISIADVIDNASRLDHKLTELPKSIELTLADRPSLFYILILLRDSIPMADIIKRYNLDQADMTLYLRDLERLGLIQQEASGQITIKLQQPIKFRQNGPLRKIIKRVNSDFLADIVERNENDTDAFLVFSRKMHKETARLVRKELEELTQRIHTLSRQDQSLSKEEELSTLKFCCCWGKVEFQELFHIAPHPDKIINEHRPKTTHGRLPV